MIPRGYENRVALGQLLEEVHREDSLRAMRYHGADIAVWDEQVIRALPEHTLAGVDKITISYNEPESYVNLPRPLLGSSHIYMQYSTTPNDLKKLPIPDSYIERYMRVAKIPAKYLVCMLNPESDYPNWRHGYVFTMPDSPPFAVDAYHLSAAAFRDKTGRRHGDIDAIPRIRKLFGTKAIEFLPEDTCGAIIAAIQRAPRASALTHSYGGWYRP